MNMWVRNQKRDRLSNCVEFYLQEKLKESYAVLGCSKNSNGHIIATYSTKAKASKVLDMIEFKLRTCFHDTTMIIFQMPTDEEVEV